VEVLYGSHYQENWFAWLEQNISFIDGIYLNRPHVTSEFLDQILTLNPLPTLSYNAIDLHYLRIARQEKLGIVGENGGYNSSQWKELELDIMRKCDVSFYFSDVELEHIRNEDDSISVEKILMYWFDSDQLDSEKPLVKDPNLLFVGGFGHPPNKDGLEWFLDEIYPSVVTAIPDVCLTIIGSKCPQEMHERENENLRILGQVSDEVLEYEYKQARISIVPLRYGAGVKGKVIESMQYGVNVLTTSIGSEGLPGDPSGYLSIADSEASFSNSLKELLLNDQMCSDNKSALNLELRENFSVESAKEIMPMMGISR
jgi:glycosyltransferase involved in cell wall biosynthesis